MERIFLNNNPTCEVKDYQTREEFYRKTVKSVNSINLNNLSEELVEAARNLILNWEKDYYKQTVKFNNSCYPGIKEQRIRNISTKFIKKIEAEMAIRTVINKDIDESECYTEKSILNILKEIFEDLNYASCYMKKIYLFNFLTNKKLNNYIKKNQESINEDEYNKNIITLQYRINNNLTILRLKAEESLNKDILEKTVIFLRKAAEHSDFINPNLPQMSNFLHSEIDTYLKSIYSH